MCCLDLIECFLQKLMILQIIPGFRKDCSLKRVGVGAKKRGRECPSTSGGIFWQAAEDMGL